MIVIPMAGLSSRFFKAGYLEPKYKLEAHGMPLFDHAVLSFSAYFKTQTFLFIVRDVFETADFVMQRCQHLGISDVKVVTIDQETRGQAETVFLGLTAIDDQQSITIFNIDTFRPNFKLPALTNVSDGYLEVFKGEGSNWSYAKPMSQNSDRVIATAEKNPISDLCSTGLYHFAKAKYFIDAFNKEVKKPPSEWQMQELYIAPLYNALIEQGLDIRYHLIERDDVVFCGVPDEYTDFVANSQPNNT